MHCISDVKIALSAKLRAKLLTDLSNVTHFNTINVKLKPTRIFFVECKFQLWDASFNGSVKNAYSPQ